MSVDWSALISSGIGLAAVSGFFGFLVARTRGKAVAQKAEAEASAAKAAAESAEHAARMNAEAQLVPPLVERIGALELRLDARTEEMHEFRVGLEACEAKHGSCQEETERLSLVIERLENQVRVVTRSMTPPPMPAQPSRDTMRDDGDESTTEG